VLINPIADKICFDYHQVLYVAILPESSSAMASLPLNKRKRGLKKAGESDTDLTSSSVSSSGASAAVNVSAPEVVKVMDIPVVITADFSSSSGKVLHITEHYDVMQILFEKEQLKHLTAIANRRLSDPTSSSSSSHPQHHAAVTSSSSSTMNNPS
jgi:hypothetical protein